MITVTIPVGPDPAYRGYLQECLDSLKSQAMPPGEVLIVDDMAKVESWRMDWGNLPVRIHRNPWLSGVAHSFNFGVALARHELVLMLGSDDKVYPWALSDCLRAWEKHKDPLGYYYCDVEYSDTGETQGCACNCAMVTKSLWRHSGGFPVGASVGACDHIYLSMLLGAKGAAGNLYHVESSKPPFWYRRHKASATASSNIWPAIEAVKERVTGHWSKPTWTG